VGTSIPVTDGAVSDVAVTDGGRVLLAGQTTGSSLAIGASAVMETEPWELFVASADAGGAIEWTHLHGGGGSDRAASVAVDAAGNSYVSGEFERAVDFGGGPLYSAGGDDLFIASYGPNGVHRWSRAFGDASDDIARSISHDDASGAQCVTTEFSGLEHRSYDGLMVEFGGGGTGAALVLR
jgi:hypothetical protein